MLNVPLVSEDCIVFELSDAVTLMVGDLANEPAVYIMEGFQPGIYKLPAEAVLQSKGGAGSFAVDTGSVFIATETAYEQLQRIQEQGQLELPDDENLQQLRSDMSYAFGFFTVGTVPSDDFTGDGTYRLDITQIRPFTPGDTASEPPQTSVQILTRALRSMNTLVCTYCFRNELNEHPELKRKWSTRAEKKIWVPSMVELALEQGWEGLDEPSSFGDFAIRCPRCRATQGTHTSERP